MSRKCECDFTPAYPTAGFMGNKGCCCSLPTLIILILIILQFSKKCRTSSSSDESSHCGKLVDNSILFIIALFYLSCCNPCKNLGC